MAYGLNELAVELRAAASAITDLLEAARDGGPISPEIDQAAAQAAATLGELAEEFGRNDVSDYARDDTLEDVPAGRHALGHAEDLEDLL